MAESIAPQPLSDDIYQRALQIDAERAAAAKAPPPPPPQAPPTVLQRIGGLLSRASGAIDQGAAASEQKMAQSRAGAPEDVDEAGVTTAAARGAARGAGGTVGAAALGTLAAPVAAASGPFAPLVEGAAGVIGYMGGDQFVQELIDASSLTADDIVAGHFTSGSAQAEQEHPGVATAASLAAGAPYVAQNLRDLAAAVKTSANEAGVNTGVKAAMEVINNGGTREEAAQAATAAARAAARIAGAKTATARIAGSFAGGAAMEPVRYGLENLPSELTTGNASPDVAPMSATAAAESGAMGTLFTAGMGARRGALPDISEIHPSGPAAGAHADLNDFSIGLLRSAQADLGDAQARAHAAGSPATPHGEDIVDAEFRDLGEPKALPAPRAPGPRTGPIAITPSGEATGVPEAVPTPQVEGARVASGLTPDVAAAQQKLAAHAPAEATGAPAGEPQAGETDLIMQRMDDGRWLLPASKDQAKAIGLKGFPFNAKAGGFVIPANRQPDVQAVINTAAYNALTPEDKQVVDLHQQAKSMDPKAVAAMPATLTSDQAVARYREIIGAPNAVRSEAQPSDTAARPASLPVPAATGGGVDLAAQATGGTEAAVAPAVSGGGERQPGGREAAAPQVAPPPAEETRTGAAAAVKRFDPRLDDPEYQDHLRHLADQAGWGTVGGRLMRAPEYEGDPNPPVIGRTPWVPHAPWFKGVQGDVPLPDNVGGEATRAAVEKAIAGGKLGARQQAHVKGMLDYIDGERQEPVSHDPYSEVVGNVVDRVGLDPRSEHDRIDQTALEHAAALDPEGFERAAIQYENDDAGLMRWAEGVIDGKSGKEADQGGEAAAPVPAAVRAKVSEPEPQYRLETHTEADLARREEERAAAEQRDRESERRAAADRERAGFKLAGSDRSADAAAAAGQLKLLEGKPDTEYHLDNERTHGEVRQPLPSEAQAAAPGRPAGAVSTATGQLDLFAPEGRAAAVPKPLYTRRVKSVQTGFFRSGIQQVKSASDAAHIVAPLRKEAQESLIALVTDADGKPLQVIRHTVGGPADASAYPGILRGAIAAVPGAKQMWFAHQHPSGSLEASVPDRVLTKRIEDGLHGTGIESRGMLIVGPGEMNAALIGTEPHGDQTVPITPAPRQAGTRVPETRRMAVRHDRGASLDEPGKARKFVREQKEPEGLALLDTQHRLLEWVPMDMAEQQKLRTGDTESGAAPLMRMVHETGATAAIIKVKPDSEASQAGMHNLADFLKDNDVHVVDVFAGDRSLALIGWRVGRGAAFASRATPGTVQTFGIYSDYGYGRFHLNSAINAAERLVFGRVMNLPVRQAFIKDERVPMRTRLDDRVIEVSGNAPPADQAQAVQNAVEEVLHMIDLVGPHTTISATMSRLDPATGDLADEALAVHKDKSNRYSAFLDYPLKEIEETDRVRAELFARLGTLYFADPRAFRASFPKAFEAYHEQFGVSEADPSTGARVQRALPARATARRNLQVGRQLQPAGSAGSRVDRGSQDWQADPGLEALRNSIAEAFGGKREGRRVELTGREAGTLQTRTPADAGVSASGAQEDGAHPERGLMDDEREEPSAFGAYTPEGLKEIGRGSIAGALGKYNRMLGGLQLQLKGWEKRFDAELRKDPDYVRLLNNDWESGREVSDPEFRPFYDQTKAIGDTLVDRLRATGKEMGYIDNYLPHLYKDPKAASNVFAQYFGKRPLRPGGFSKERFYETLEAAREAGLEPISENPVDLLLAHWSQMGKAVVWSELRNDWEKRGLVIDDPGRFRAPAGWGRVNDPMFQGKLVPEQLARDLNTVISPGMYQVWGWNHFRRFENMAVAANLAWSLFHGSYTTLDNIGNFATMSGGYLARGDLGKSIEMLGRGLAAPFNAVAGLAGKGEGSALIKQYFGLTNPDPNTAALLDSLMKGGSRVYMHATDWNDDLGQLAKAARQGKWMTALAKGLPGALETMAYPIMRNLVPAQKMIAKVHLLKFELDRYAKQLEQKKGDYAGVVKAMNPDVLAQISRRINQDVDARLGQHNYDNLFMNRFARDWAQAAVTSFGWVYGYLDFLFGGLRDVGRVYRPERMVGPLAAAGGEAGTMPRFTNRLAFMLTLSAITAALNGGLTYSMTGESPRGMDFYAYRTGRKNPDGSDERMTLPTMLKEVYHWAHAPVETGLGKINTGVSLLYNGVGVLSALAGEDSKLNRDYLGNFIVNPADDLHTQLRQAGAYFWDRLLPISVKVAQKNDAMGKDFAEQAAPFFGFTPAPKSMSSSELSDFLMHEHYARRGAMTPEEVEASHRFAAAVNDQKAGRNPDLSQFSPRQRLGIREAARSSIQEHFFKELPLEQKLAAWDNATDDERQQLNLKRAFTPAAVATAKAKLAPDERLALQTRVNAIRSWQPPMPPGGAYAAQ